MTTRSNLSIATLISFLVVAPAVHASQPESHPAAAEDYSVAMDDLYEASNMNAIFDMLTSALLDQLIPKINELNAGKEELVLQIVKTEFKTAFLAKKPEMLREMAKLYAQHFTVSEIREMAAFYRTPLGIKLLEKLPILTTEGFAIGKAVGEGAAREAIRAAMEKLKTEGLKVPDLRV